MLTDETRRRDFPTLAEKTYLNTAAEGIPPQAVLHALNRYGEDKLLGMDGRVRHDLEWQAVRRLAAQAFGLTTDEIGICSCASEAFNLAALALQLDTDDEVIINDLDFPAGATPWLQASCAAQVKLWRSRDGALRTEDLMPLLTQSTKLVTTSLVSFYNGYRISLDEVTATVRRHSPALLVVDVTQALGRITVDLREVDLIVSATHKWLLASHGGGLVGVPRARAAVWTVPAGGWFNLQNAFDADRFERTATKPGAASFGVGMPNYPAIYAIRAAFDYLLGVTVEAIEAQANSLVELCLKELKELPVELLTPSDPATLAGIIAFRHPRAGTIHQHLHEEQIHVMYHAGRLRVALHGYNTAADVDRFVCALREALDDA